MKDRAHGIGRNCEYDGYQRALESRIYKFFDKRTRSGINVNEELAEKVHKPVNKKFKRRKVYTIFKDNIWAGDLAGVGSLSSENQYVKYLFCISRCFH